MLIFLNKINWYTLQKNVNIFFNEKKSIIYIKNNLGLISIKLPSFYLFNSNLKNINIVFTNKNWYKFFKNNFLICYKNLCILYFIRLKIKGLGYRIRKITKNFYYFFFNFTNMYYFNIPKNIIIKWYKKRIIFISYNFQLVKLLISTIIILKKIGPYQIRGLKYPRQIILIKKRKKSF